MCGAVTIPELKARFDAASRCQIVDAITRRYIGEPDALLDELRAAGFAITGSTVHARRDDDDQDHLWAIATSPPA